MNAERYTFLMGTFLWVIQTKRVALIIYCSIKVYLRASCYKNESSFLIAQQLVLNVVNITQFCTGMGGSCAQAKFQLR